MGDFNAIRNLLEAFEGSPTCSDMEEFERAIMDVVLVLVNEDWVMSRPNGVVQVSPWGVFDHSVRLFSPGDNVRRWTSVFPFINHWVEAAGFVDFVASVSTHDQRVSPLVSLMRNLKALNPVLHERAAWVLSRWATTTLVVADIVQFRWPEECRIDLCHPFTWEEIRRVLFFMKSSKVLDLDGFVVDFFKPAWFVVGEDFCAAVSHLFDSFYLP
ncbi:unnamed protein product [Citrullus colocynthis]|uniref:Uncharacterized protein n=1 Tax=Citrullus colocynthis TaxID=252529 RepID=A0ABP0YGA3_9ROSI